MNDSLAFLTFVIFFFVVALTDIMFSKLFSICKVIRISIVNGSLIEEKVVLWVTLCIITSLIINI